MKAKVYIRSWQASHGDGNPFPPVFYGCVHYGFRGLKHHLWQSKTYKSRSSCRGVVNKFLNLNGLEEANEPN